MFGGEFPSYEAASSERVRFGFAHFSPAQETLCLPRMNLTVRGILTELTKIVGIVIESMDGSR